MATPAQIAANQLNSCHSTGPRTDSGKAASSRNNLRHGFRSQSVLLPGDDPAEYEALFDELTAHFAPDDLTEERMVREMADAEWRLRRVRQYLESALSRRIAELSTEHPSLDPIGLQSLAVESLQTAGRASYGTWLAYESKFERQHDRALNNWYRYQDMRRSAGARHADTLVKQIFAPLPPPAPAAAPEPESPKLASNVQTIAPPQTPRSTPCPCGSGRKYKRCCGHAAGPVLSTSSDRGTQQSPCAA